MLAGAEPAPGTGRSPAEGHFIREHWYRHGVEHGNPDFNRRFRVNAPEVVLHPQFGRRIEARSSGMMVILAEEDLSRISSAELYLELWGGHPGSANKRVTLNGRRTFAIPEVGTAAGHCTHQYPVIALEATDLVNGYNALQFAVDQGSSFWGHFIVDGAALRMTLPRDHPAVVESALAGFRAALQSDSPAAGRETIRLRLAAEGLDLDRIAAVEFQGHYFGYDENGDGQSSDWHGFTKERAPVGHLGTVTQPPFAFEWNTRLLPAQSDMGARAVVRFKDQTNLFYLTPTLEGLKTAERTGDRVMLYPIRNLPPQFWSRAGRRKEAVIDLEEDPARILEAELHVVVWDGGAGAVRDYFKLNGQAFPVAGAGRHDVRYSRLPVDPKLLRRGPNTIELLSDTEHHGIEVLRPGPALVVRSRL